jgi:hypothetical protein
MFTISNKELEDKPIVKAGDKISCKRCGKKHILRKAEGVIDNSDKIEVKGDLLYYKCGENVYLGLVANRLISRETK